MLYLAWSIGASCSFLFCCGKPLAHQKCSELFCGLNFSFAFPFQGQGGAGGVDQCLMQSDFIAGVGP